MTTPQAYLVWSEAEYRYCWSDIAIILTLFIEIPESHICRLRGFELAARYMAKVNCDCPCIRGLDFRLHRP